MYDQFSVSSPGLELSVSVDPKEWKPVCKVFITEHTQFKKTTGVPMMQLDCTVL